MKFTEDHEWLSREGDVVTIGITAHAAAALGDLVFIQLPEVGAVFGKGDGAAVVESVKAASDVFAPLPGEIVAVNETISADPSLVSSDPQGAGWFFKMRLSEPAAFDALMDEPAYKSLIA